jgi:hypothetical protein
MMHPINFSTARDCIGKLTRRAIILIKAAASGGFDALT